VTIEEAKKFVGREVFYQGHSSVITNVREIQDGRMILAYTNKNWVLNIEILRYKDENGNLKSID
jgi:hypothetical protein